MREKAQKRKEQILDIEQEMPKIEEFQKVLLKEFFDGADANREEEKCWSWLIQVINYIEKYRKFNMHEYLAQNPDMEKFKQTLWEKKGEDAKKNMIGYIQKHAYELGKAIIRKESEEEEKNTRKLNLSSRPYALPRLPGRLENFEYEMYAIFLLLPLELFFEEFRKYLDKIIKHPVLIEDWIEHLSRKAGIPRYQLINGYEYIKFAAYQYYQENLSKEVKGIDYRGLFNL